MKRILAVSILAAAVGTLAGAQALDKPAATVKLTRTEVITVTQLQKQVAPLETQAKQAFTVAQRRTVLDGLIARALIQQAAERDKVAVSDAELKAKLETYRKAQSQALNLGRDLTEAEFQQAVRNAGANWDEWLANFKYNLLLNDYAQFKNKNIAAGVAPVTDQDIQDAYDASKSAYFVDDIVTLRHVFVDTRQLTTKEDKDKAARRADDILKELRAGAAFTDLVTKYSDDTSSKYNGGTFVSLVRTDTTRRQLYGAAFFDAVFKLRKGEVSGVLQSNVGHHIVQVADRFDAKLLTLDDKIPPLYSSTVRELIRSNLAVQRQNDAVAAALNAIVADLKKVAEIKYFDANLAW